MPTTNEKECEDVDARVARDEEARVGLDESSLSSSSNSSNSSSTQADAAGAPPAITFPDGGLQAWSNIAGCTLISLTAFGASVVHPSIALSLITDYFTTR